MEVFSVQNNLFSVQNAHPIKQADKRVQNKSKEACFGVCEVSRTGFEVSRTGFGVGICRRIKVSRTKTIMSLHGWGSVQNRKGKPIQVSRTIFLNWRTDGVQGNEPAKVSRTIFEQVHGGSVQNKIVSRTNTP